MIHSEEREIIRATDLHVSVLEDSQAFASLEAEWDDLYLDSPNSTPFQSWGWLFSWWQAYESPNLSLRIITLRESSGGNALVGVLPMMIKRKAPSLGVLCFVGEGVTDYLDVLVRGGWEREVSEAGAEALTNLSGWSVADLSRLREGASSFALIEKITPSGKVVFLDEGRDLTLKTNDWEEILASLSRKRRETARRTTKRATRAGLKVREITAEAEDFGKSARRWISLHHRYWQGRDISTEHLTPRFVTLLEAATRRMTRAGTGRLHEFVLEDRVVAADFVLLGHDFVSGYLEGADPHHIRGYELNTLYTRSWADSAKRAKIPNVSFMVGEEPYKLKWNPKSTPVVRAVFGRTSLFHALYSNALDLRYRTISYLKDKDSPRPVALLGGALKYARSTLRRARATRLADREPGDQE